MANSSVNNSWCTNYLQNRSNLIIEMRRLRVLLVSFSVWFAVITHSSGHTMIFIERNHPGKVNADPIFAQVFPLRQRKKSCIILKCQQNWSKINRWLNF